MAVTVTMYIAHWRCHVYRATCSYACDVQCSYCFDPQAGDALQRDALRTQGQSRGSEEVCGGGRAHLIPTCTEGGGSTHLIPSPCTEGAGSTHMIHARRAEVAHT